MRELNAVRAAAAASLYLAAAHQAGMPLPGILQGVMLVFCCLACGGAGLMAKSMFRWLFAAVPFCLLFVSHGGIVQWILPAVYFETLICTKLIHTNKWHYRKIHMLYLTAAVILSVVAAIRSRFTVSTILLCTVTMVFSTCFQRQLIAGRAGGGRNGCLDLLSVCAIPAGAGVLAAFWTIGKGIFRLLLLVIGGVFGGLLWALNMLLTFFGRGLVENLVEETEVTTQPTIESLLQEKSTAFTETPVTIQQMHMPDWILPCILTFLLISLALFLLDYIRRRKITVVQTIEENEEPEEVQRVSVSGKTDLSLRRQVRKVYAEYLKLVRTGGYFPNLSDTSQQIQTADSKFSGMLQSEELRQIYIRARYDTGRQVTQEDLHRAKQLLKEIKKNPRYK